MNMKRKSCCKGCDCQVSESFYSSGDVDPFVFYSQCYSCRIPTNGCLKLIGGSDDFVILLRCPDTIGIQNIAQWENRYTLPTAYWIFRNTSGAVDGWRNTFTDGVRTYRLADWDPNTLGGDFAVIDIEKGGFVTHDWTEGIPYAWLAANGFAEGGRVRFKFAYIPSGGYGNASIWTNNDCDCGTSQAAVLVDPQAQALWAKQTGGCTGCGNTPLVPSVALGW